MSISLSNQILQILARNKKTALIALIVAVLIAAVLLMPHILSKKEEKS